MLVFTFISSLAGFVCLDKLLTLCRLEGVYYFIHSLHNAGIVYTTANDVLTTVTDFHALERYPNNDIAIGLCFALHIYHILIYWRKFRFDDWLHHGLMIFLALPIGVMLPSSTLTGYSLFFTTGLPGGIDYFLLFLVRNGWLQRLTEKRINRWLNVWIRSPGCASHAVLTCTYMLSGGNGFHWIGFLPALLVGWNGQYFLNQVVEDHVLQHSTHAHIV